MIELLKSMFHFSFRGEKKRLFEMSVSNLEMTAQEQFRRTIMGKPTGEQLDHFVQKLALDYCQKGCMKSRITNHNTSNQKYYSMIQI